MRILVVPRVVPVVAAGLALQARPARAEPHQMCLYLDIGVDYWDASPRAADGEDFREEYGRNEGPTSYPAQRWLARVRDEEADEIVFGWRPLDANGCAAFELAGGETELTMEWMRWAVWNEEVETGNQLVGYHCDAVMTSCDLVPQRLAVPANMATGVTEIIIGSDIGEEVDLVFWATTFAEERFASLGDQPLDDTRIYVGYDPQDILPGRTQADRTFGNQPSVVIAGESWHSKFTIAHELGHQQTMVASQAAFGPADFDYCYDPAVYPVTAAGCMPDHGLTSHEWQAAAALEGIASWYAVSAWNDVDLVECGACQSGVRYVIPKAADDELVYAVPRQTPRCTELDEPQCPAGVGNEWDWLSAFRLFVSMLPRGRAFARCSPCSRRSMPRAIGASTSPATLSGRPSTRRWRRTWERTTRPGRRPQCRWSSTDDEVDSTDRGPRRDGSIRRVR